MKCNSLISLQCRKVSVWSHPVIKILSSIAFFRNIAQNGPEFFYFDVFWCIWCISFKVPSTMMVFPGKSICFVWSAVISKIEYSRSYINFDLHNKRIKHDILFFFKGRGDCCRNHTDHPSLTYFINFLKFNFLLCYHLSLQ